MLMIKLRRVSQKVPVKDSQKGLDDRHAIPGKSRKIYEHLSRLFKQDN